MGNYNSGSGNHGSESPLPFLAFNLYVSGVECGVLSISVILKNHTCDFKSHGLQNTNNVYDTDADSLKVCQILAAHSSPPPASFQCRAGMLSYRTIVPGSFCSCNASQVGRQAACPN